MLGAPQLGQNEVDVHITQPNWFLKYANDGAERNSLSPINLNREIPPFKWIINAAKSQYKRVE